jgi:23S rRNA pseudouridine1911/1915/1917 synthase
MIVYVDSDFAVVVKEAGEVCEDGSPHSLTLRMAPLIEEELGHKLERCECVHRLDQPVSGLCILALTDRAVTSFSKIFASHSVEKTYCAITERKKSAQGEVQSEISADWKNLECLMTFDRGKKKARILSEKEAQRAGKAAGKKALLRYKLLGQGERYDFLLVELFTGRTHQIRCQLAGEGRPVKGDLKYGAKRSEKGGGIRLHAWKLSFSHPVTGECLTFTCMPPQMDALWQACMGFLC